MPLQKLSEIEEELQKDYINIKHRYIKLKRFFTNMPDMVKNINTLDRVYNCKSIQLQKGRLEESES